MVANSRSHSRCSRIRISQGFMRLNKIVVHEVERDCVDRGIKKFNEDWFCDATWHGLLFELFPCVVGALIYRTWPFHL